MKDRSVLAAGDQAPPRHLETLAASRGEAHRPPNDAADQLLFCPTARPAPPARARLRALHRWRLRPLPSRRAGLHVCTTAAHQLL